MIIVDSPGVSARIQQCMDVSAFSDAAPVVQVSCAIQAIGNGVATLGESMQVWQCNPRTRNQDWDILPPFQKADADVAAAGPMAAASQAGLIDYDDELRRHNEVLRRAYGVQPRDRVLDIGCGCGQTTREVARMASAGSALGVDISGSFIERARELAEVQGVRNVSFEQADAEVHRFPRERFDLVISRFGTMFFVDPVTAFTNIGRALRPDGRLVMMVWQAHDRNEWNMAIRRCLEGAAGVASAGPDPFSLADPPVVTGMLEDAGFADVAFTDVREPMYFGPDVATALDWVRGFACTREVLDRLDPDAAARALGRLRVTLAEHNGNRGIKFDSRAWIVTARR